jgi:hypothetical protein
VGPVVGPDLHALPEHEVADEFAYDLGVGVRWDLQGGFTLRAAYEKHWWDYSKASSTPDFDQLKLGLYFRY